MDQFSHDLTVALEETSLMDRASGVGRWGSRRRTRSTGNLPCAPQPTEDSSSSPTDTLNALGHHHQQPQQQQHHHHHHHHHHHQNHPSANVDGLDTHNLKLPASDSDEKAEAMLPLRLLLRPGALESDSLNETTFSPARFYKPNSRRKRKIKRMSMEFEFSKDTTPHSFTESPLQPGMLSATGATATGTIRKRLLKADGHRSHLFFCGKRKRSNRDRYHEQEPGKLYTMPPQDVEQQHQHHQQQQQRMRPRSYSSTSKPLSDRLLPLNKGLLSKINRMAAQGQQAKAMPNQKTDKELKDRPLDEAGQEIQMDDDLELLSRVKDDVKEMPSLPPPPSSAEVPSKNNLDFFSMDTIVPVTDIDALLLSSPPSAPPLLRKKTPAAASSSTTTTKTHRRRRFQALPHQQQPQPQPQSMDCSELYDFLSSSSLSSSSDSEPDVGGHGGHRRRHDTDREGDDELTDWPGNEFGPGARYDPKRKLTKKSLLPQIRSDDTIGEDDTLMSGTEAAGAMEPPPKSPESLQDLPRFQLPNAVSASSEPIEILNAGCEMETNAIMPAPRQIESEMSGETSNPFLSSSPPGLGQGQEEVREIRAGCRRINGERAGFSIKLSVNERLARFLQDPRQTQIRLPDIELYEPDGNLSNLATLYSLTMLVEQGCTVLTKTRNTTQSVSMDHLQHGLQPPPPDLFGDFKRRCYGEEEPQEPQEPGHK
ncbi:hypothetical protein KR059_012721 [Drosophila kikkawai]|nr:hypothetical protein KR059_012721 [Drosophila kikkawai]